VGTQLFTAAFDYVYNGYAGPRAIVYANSGLGGCIDSAGKDVLLDMDRAYNHDHQAQIDQLGARVSVVFRWNGGAFGSVSNPVTCRELLLDMATMDGNQEFHMRVPINPVVLDGVLAKY
jgi:hypothetical protein